MSLTMDELEQIYQRGFELRCEGRYGEARAQLQQILAKDPGHIRAKHQMGLIQGFEGDFDGSLETLQSLTLIAPRNVDILYDLAMTQMMLGLQDEACANFRQILAIEPSYDKAAKQLVYC
jgi:tetratricopeptide (TPR) repeat protein